VRVIVTGGAGFIGSHLVDTLLTRGDQVTVADDLSAGRPDRLPAAARLCKLDITDAAALTELARQDQPEVIFHCAARVSVPASVQDPLGDARTSVLGTIGVLQAAKLAGARVVFTSSCSVYGPNAPVPASEQATPAPASPYAAGKLAAEQYLSMWNQFHGTHHVILRLANVFGPRQENGVVSVFCRRALEGQSLIIHGFGTQTRDFVFVTDAVGALIAAADLSSAGIWNVGTGVQTSVFRLALLIRTIAGRRAMPVELSQYRQGDLLHSALAASKAEHDLGWKPAVSLEDGIREVVRELTAETLRC